MGNILGSKSSGRSQNITIDNLQGIGGKAYRGLGNLPF